MDEAVDINAAACHVQLQLAEQAQRRCIHLLSQIRTFVNEATEPPYDGPVAAPRLDLQGRSLQLASSMQLIEVQLSQLISDLGVNENGGIWREGAISKGDIRANA